MQAQARVPFWAVGLLVLIALGAWQAAFVVIGMGSEGPVVQKVPPPPYVTLVPPDTSWVDLDAYLRNDPFWRL